MKQAILFAVLFGATLCTHAVDVYKCKGSQGETIYQNEPCPQGAKEVAKGEYQRQPDDPTQYEAAMAEQATQQQSVQAQTYQASQTTLDTGQSSDQPQQAGQQTAAYQCEAGGKTWISSKPCPNTVTKARTVTRNIPFDGTDQYGNMVSGTGILTERIKEDHAVQQQGLSHDELCKRLQDQMATSYNKKAGSGDSIYERNKQRQANGC